MATTGAKGALIYISTLSECPPTVSDRLHAARPRRRRPRRRRRRPVALFARLLLAAVTVPVAVTVAFSSEVSCPLFPLTPTLPAESVVVAAMAVVAVATVDVVAVAVAAMAVVAMAAVAAMAVAVAARAATVALLEKFFCRKEIFARCHY